MFTSLQNHFSQSSMRVREIFSDTGTRLCSLMKIGPESSLRIRRRQFLWGGCLVISIIAFTYGIMTVLLDRGPVVKKQTEALKPVETHIATAPKHVNMDEVRWHTLDEAIKKLGKEVSEIKRVVNGEEIGTSNDVNIIELPGNTENPDSPENQSSFHNTPHQQAHNASTDVANSHDPRFQDIQERLSFLETEREASKNQPNSNLQNSYAQNPVIEGQQDGGVIQKLSLNLVSQSKNLKTVETTIPAGAFAKTVLLSGLDASSAMNSSSDPRPMLLRIIDHGTLPRRFQSDLKDCHCTAGAYGDLSSERVYARLEKLTCVERSTGEIIETQVSGYVAGSDGKTGIRGVVASRDGQFLARSLMGGIFSGLSNVANPQNQKAQVNPFFGGAAGSQVAGPTLGENFISGMASGATTALDRLSQYYIDRAEQLQPVIQIPAGQVVDIVFTMGTFIGSQDRKQKSDNSAQKQDNTSQQTTRN